MSGALLGRQPSERFIDPMDGLAVITHAAELALTAQEKSQPQVNSNLQIQSLDRKSVV